MLSITCRARRFPLGVFITTLVLGSFLGCTETETSRQNYSDRTCEQLVAADSQSLAVVDVYRRAGCLSGYQERRCETEQAQREARGLPGLQGPECRRYYQMQEDFKPGRSTTPSPVIILPPW
jgi:hypothetical protein